MSNLPIILVILFVLVVNYLQSKVPITIDLPIWLKTWNFLPLPLRSLEPYDRFIMRFLCKCLYKHPKVIPEKPNLHDLDVIVKESRTTFF